MSSHTTAEWQKVCWITLPYGLNGANLQLAVLALFQPADENDPDMQQPSGVWQDWPNSLSSRKFWLQDGNGAGIPLGVGTNGDSNTWMGIFGRSRTRSETVPIAFGKPSALYGNQS